MFKNYQEAADYIAENGIKMVNFKEIDLAGRWHHLTIPAERFSPGLLKKGIGFAGSSYGFAPVENSDMVFIPDVTSAFVDPIAEMPMLTMIGDIYTAGKELARFEKDPRYIAEKAEKYMRDTGVSDKCLFGPEFEFYVLDNIEYRVEQNHIEVHLDSAPASWNSFDSPYAPPFNNTGFKVGFEKGYHVDIPHDVSFDLRNTITRALEDCDIPIAYHHTENGGPGQVEIEVEFATLKEMADRSQKLKYIVRNLAVKNGKSVTFMPKPFHGASGNGMHIHLQMFNKGEPIFYDKDGYSFLSQTALYAIGGVMKHSPALLAFTNPSTNSYKRLVPGYSAPVTICFATANRSSVIRIPAYAMAPEDKRFEFRPSDATCNPYLAFSALAMAMVDGIVNKIDPAPYGPFDKNMYYLTEEEKGRIGYLPKSVEEAIAAIEADHEFLLAGGVFTKGLIDDQIRALRRDAEEISIVPHPAEYAKYYDL
ncbi:MAG: type I glutamate--ammonia ligase [Defluviitaleaceae bacterium]|nr:type I glutamate--ammonia ligase [Defluviitaleaceae bacterium]